MFQGHVSVKSFCNVCRCLYCLSSVKMGVYSAFMHYGHVRRHLAKMYLDANKLCSICLMYEYISEYRRTADISGVYSNTL